MQIAVALLFCVIGSATRFADPLSDALYKNPAQPIQARVADLLSHMTLAEKAAQPRRPREPKRPQDDPKNGAAQDAERAQ